LDVTGCTALKRLNCEFNGLNSLDVTGCTALKYLYCHSTALTSLDVSGCAKLYNLDCHFNELTSLDVSNNTRLLYLDISDMETLFEVCVWKLPFPPAGINVNTTDSPFVYFTIDCNN
jgi:hypothetical protein